MSEVASMPTARDIARRIADEIEDDVYAIDFTISSGGEVSDAFLSGRGLTLIEQVIATALKAGGIRP